jgi:hypothetical protein
MAIQGFHILAIYYHYEPKMLRPSRTSYHGFPELRFFCHQDVTGPHASDPGGVYGLLSNPAQARSSKEPQTRIPALAGFENLTEAVLRQKEVKERQEVPMAGQQTLKQPKPALFMQSSPLYLDCQSPDDDLPQVQSSLSEPPMMLVDGLRISTRIPFTFSQRIFSTVRFGKTLFKVGI